jgi:hypothetical protein
MSALLIIAIVGSLSSFVLIFADSPAANIFGLCAGIALFFVALTASWENGHRSGCIDAMNGRPPYVLTTQPDGSTEWARKVNQ